MTLQNISLQFFLPSFLFPCLPSIHPSFLPSNCRLSRQDLILGIRRKFIFVEVLCIQRQMLFSYNFRALPFRAENDIFCAPCDLNSHRRRQSFPILAAPSLFCRLSSPLFWTFHFFTRFLCRPTDPPCSLSCAPLTFFPPILRSLVFSLIPFPDSPDFPLPSLTLPLLCSVY